MQGEPKLSQSEFASKVRAKYNAYKDIDDSTLVSSILKKYPEYANSIDMSTVKTVDGTQSKLKQAISKDRDKISSYIDYIIPTTFNLKLGAEAAKVTGSLLKGAASGIESLMYGMAEMSSYMLPSAGVGAPSPVYRKADELRARTPEERKEMLKDVKKAGKQVTDKIQVSYTPEEAKFNVMDGFGLSDAKALPEMIGRVAIDMPMGAATGATTFFVQGYGDALKDYDERIERSGEPEDEKSRQFYGVAVGTINGFLERYAIDKMFTGPAFKKVKSKILADVLKRTSAMEGKIGIDAIELMVAQETKKAMSTMKNRGIKALYAAGVESGTEGLQSGLQDVSKLITNSIRGNEIFSEEEVKQNFASNVINSSAAGGILGFGIGGTMSLIPDTKNQILESVANIKTEEEAEIFTTDLEQTLNDERMSEEEKEIVRAQVKKYSEIKQKIPKDIPVDIQTKAIKLIEARNEVDAHIKQKEAEIEGMDEAIASEENRMLEFFKDARNSFNDKIRDVVSGDKTKYYEQDGKYYKQVGENEPEIITKNRFEFEESYNEEPPQGPTEQETAKTNLDNTINDINKQRQEEHSGLLKSPLTGVEDYNGEFDNESVAEYANNIRNNNKLSKKAAAALNLWEKTVNDINNKYDQQVELETKKYNDNATTTNENQQQEGVQEGNVSERQGIEGEQAQTTNETDNSNSVVSQQAQVTDVPTAPIKNRVMLFFKKQFSPFGVIGRTLTSLKERIPGYISAEMKRAEISQKRVAKLIQKYKNTVTPESIDDYLSGRPTTEPIPDELAIELTKMRNHIDSMTDALIENGVITDPAEIELFKSNKGSYLTRAYELFDSKNVNIDNVTKKLTNVDQTVLDNALEYLANMIYNQSTQGNLFDGNQTMTREESMNLARAMANKILADEENPFTKKKIEGSLNAKSLKERQDIAAPLRALMGEYTDPLHKYMITTYKMAALISSQKYMAELRNVGLGKFLFKEGDPNAPAEATALIAGENSETMSPLAGLYTFPELKAALEQAQKENTFILTKVAGTIRAFKTVYNPMTHVKNVLGNLGFLVSNAHWSKSQEAFELVRELVTGKDNQRLNELIFKLNAFGVLNNTVGIGELQAYFDKHNSLDELLDNVYNKQDSRIKKFAKSSWSKLKNGPQVAYQMEDDIFKIIAYVNESSRYSEAIYGKSYQSLTAEEKNDIDERTSEIVKNTYPTFSRVPQFVKNLSKVFFVGNFLAFPVESVRVSYESAMLASREIKSGNSKLKDIGYQRFAGMIAYNGLVSAATYLGVLGASGMAGFLFGDDKEKKKQKASRMFMPEWTQDKDVYISKFQDGRLVYVDIGGSDPYGYQKEAFNAFWNNINDGKGFAMAMANSIAKAAHPFTEIDMTVKAVGNLIYNEDDNGNDIIKSSDTPAQKSAKIMAYLNKKVSPGAITTAVKMYDYYNDDKEKFSAEAASLSGYRMYDIDLLKQFGIIMNSKDKSVLAPKGAFKARINDDYIKVWNAIKLGDKPQSFKDEEYERLSSGVKDVLKEVRTYYEAAIEGGVKESDLLNSLIRSGIPRTHIQSIISNNFNNPNSYYLRK